MTNAAYAQYCSDYRATRPDPPLPTLEELAEFLEYQCPPEAMAEANERLALSLNQKLSFDTASFHSSDGEEKVSNLKPKTLCAIPDSGQIDQSNSLAEVLKGFDEARRSNPAIQLNPLAPLVRAWQNRYRPPNQVQVLTAGRARLTRMPNDLATVALAEWEEIPAPELRMVTVDGPAGGQRNRRQTRISATPPTKATRQPAKETLRPARQPGCRRPRAAPDARAREGSATGRPAR